MASAYKIVYKGGTGEIVEKKSRFIANVFPVTDEEEALSIIEQTKKKYWDARHNCYAYIIGEDGRYQRCSDDGEPQGTAGRPMLDVIAGEKLCNVLGIVTRYFGGTLLGTGGLVRAYSQSVRAGIDASQIVLKSPAREVHIYTDYNGAGKLQYIMSTNDINVLDTIYTDKVEMIALVPEDMYGTIESKVNEATSASALMEDAGEIWYAILADKSVHVFSED